MSRPIQHPEPKNRVFPWIKSAMILATILWPILGAGAAWLNMALTQVEIKRRPLNLDTYVDHAEVLYLGSVEAAVDAVISVTLAYAVIIGALQVLLVRNERRLTRPWLRFSLKAMLLLIAAAACCFAWGGRELRVVQQRVRERIRLEAGNAKVYELEDGQSVRLVTIWRQHHLAEEYIFSSRRPSEMSWLRILLGDKNLGSICFDHALSATDWEAVEAFPEADIGAPESQNDPHVLGRDRASDRRLR